MSLENSHEAQTSRTNLLCHAQEKALQFLQRGERANAAISLLSDFQELKIYPPDEPVFMRLTMAQINPSMVNETFIMGFQ